MTNNQLIIVNGATRGLGFELVKKIINSNHYDLLCIVRNTNNLSKLEIYRDDIHLIEFDYKQPSKIIDVETQLNQLSSDYNKVYFINNLSIIEPIGKLGNIDSNKIIENISINFSSNLLVINLFLKIFSMKSTCYLLNISSGIANNPVPGLGLYGMSKNFIDYITRVIEVENKKTKVASFHPGGMKTDMQGLLQKQLTDNEDLKEFNYEKILNQRLFTPSEIASVIHAEFLQENSGWSNLISNVYDYYEG